MIEEVCAVRYTCDSPGCESEDVVDADTGPPVGWLAGSVTMGDYDGDRAGEWVACRVTHVRGAIEARLA